MSKRLKAIEKITPTQLKYLQAVINYPMTKHPQDNFYDVYIAQIARYGKYWGGFCSRDYAWGSNMRRNIAKRLTREELLEVCEEIMKEAA